MIDGAYHLFDPFHAGDCQAVPYMYLLKEDPSHIYTTRTVMYNILQEVGRFIIYPSMTYVDGSSSPLIS